MKHYYIIKDSRKNIERVYECWCDFETAKGFKYALEKQYGCYLTLLEVVHV